MTAPILLWCDTETSGLDPKRNSLIEVAAVVEVEGIVRAQLSALVHDGEDVLWREEAYRMHEKSGLLAAWHGARQSKGTMTPAQVESILLSHLRMLAKPRTVKLAGSSVHFDRSFLKRFMPDLDAFLHYRHVDVTVLNEAFVDNVDGRWKSKGESAHRAEQDINWSRQRYNELTAELKKLRTTEETNG